MPSTVLFVVGGTAVTATTIAVFAAKTLLAVVISSLFAKKPKGSDLSAAGRDQQITARDPVAPWRVIYGETLTGGTIVFLHTTAQEASDIATVNEQHAAAAAVTLQAAGTWLSDIGVDFEDYDDDGDYAYTALTAVGSNPAQGQYSVAAGVYTFNAADFNRSVRISATLRVNQRVVGKFLHLVIELAGHEVEEIGDIYFDNEVVPLDGNGVATGRFAGHVSVIKHLGATDQAADAQLMYYAPDKWTSAHQLRGRAYIYVRLTKQPSTELFPSGVPNIRAKVKGRKVYDPRSATTAWSANPALCITDYLTNTTFGLGHVYADELDEDLLTAAANVCDENVNLAAGGTEDRYTCNGTFLTSEAPKDILGRLQVAMAGRCVRSGGRWGLYAGAYLTPTVTLDEDDLRGPIQVRPRLSRREVFNGVKGVFASPDNGYQPADFPAVTNSTYLSEDQDERIWLDVDLQYTGSAATAQRIAKIELERVRQQISVVLPCKLSAWQVVPPQTVMLTNSKFGWSAKVFEVVETRLVIDKDAEGAPYLGADLVLRETASTVYDWDSGEETAVDPAPDTNLPNPFAIAPPGTPAVAETLYETTGSAGVKSRAAVTWSAGGDAQAVQYGLEYRVSGDTAWIQRPLVRGLSDTLDDLAPDDYEFRVRAFNNIGFGSAYSPTTAREIFGLSAPPAAVAGFSVIKSGGIGIAQWTLHTDLDVQINGSVIIRHSPLTTGALWVDGIILEVFPGGVVSGIVPLITGTYMAKARDSSGNYSAAMVDFVATEGLVTGFNVVATSTQHPDFTGAKTNVAVIEDALRLDSVTLIGDMLTPISEWPYIASLGGITGAGSYAFDAAVDLGTVATRRFESDISALSFDTGDLIGFRLDPISQWPSIAGEEVDDCDATLYARTTDDDPAGTPTWGAWTPFFVADFTCRAAQFKLDLASAISTNNITISELAVVVKEAA